MTVNRDEFAMIITRVNGRVTKGGLCSGEQLCFHVLGRQFLVSGAGERNTIEINTTETKLRLGGDIKINCL
jgi:hypothetical protein